MNFKNKTLSYSGNLNAVKTSPQTHTAKEAKAYQIFQNVYTIPNQIKGLSLSTSNPITSKSKPTLDYTLKRLFAQEKDEPRLSHSGPKKTQSQYILTNLLESMKPKHHNSSKSRGLQNVNTPPMALSPKREKSTSTSNKSIQTFLQNLQNLLTQQQQSSFGESVTKLKDFVCGFKFHSMHASFESIGFQLQTVLIKLIATFEGLSAQQLSSQQEQIHQLIQQNRQFQLQIKVFEEEKHKLKRLIQQNIIDGIVSADQIISKQGPKNKSSCRLHQSKLKC